MSEKAKAKVVDAKVENTKVEAKEDKDTSVKDTSVKRFNLTVSGTNGEEFTFSGPEGAPVALLENVAYTLLTRFVYHRIHEAMIKEAQAKEDTSVEDKKQAGLKEKEEDIKK